MAESQTEGFNRQLRERVHQIAAGLGRRFNDTAIGRVAVRFAVVQVGLEIAHSYDLLPFPIEQCGWAVRQLFTAWLDSRGGEGSIEIKEACKRIEHLFVSNQFWLETSEQDRENTNFSMGHLSQMSQVSQPKNTIPEIVLKKLIEGVVDSR